MSGLRAQALPLDPKFLGMTQPPDPRLLGMTCPKDPSYLGLAWLVGPGVWVMPDLGIELKIYIITKEEKKKEKIDFLLKE